MDERLNMKKQEISDPETRLFLLVCLLCLHRRAGCGRSIKSKVESGVSVLLHACIEGGEWIYKDAHEKQCFEVTTIVPWLRASCE